MYTLSFSFAYFILRFLITGLAGWLVGWLGLGWDGV